MTKCLTLQIEEHFGHSVGQIPIGFRITAAAWMIALRFSLALLLFACFFPSAMRRVRLSHFTAGAVIGLAFLVGLVFQVVGLATIPASRSGFLTSLTVVFIPLFSTAIGRRLPRLTILAAAAVAIAGVSVLTGLISIGDGSISLADDALRGWNYGDSLTILGAVFFSIQVMLLDSYGKRHDSLELTPSMFATTAVGGWIVLAVSLWLAPQGSDQAGIGNWISVGVKPTFWSLIVTLAIFPSMVAFVWMNIYQPVVSAIQAGIIYTLEPVFASTFAMFLPAILSSLCLVAYENETFTMPLLFGGLLVIIANLLALWPDSHRTLKPAA